MVLDNIVNILSCQCVDVLACVFLKEFIEFIEF